MDFECTCEEVILAYPHEIIEFPAVLIDVQQRKIIDQFRSFVRPKLNPILDPFCIRFTHITQSAVDNAPQFHEVVMAFQQWLITQGLGPGGHRFAFVTDGPHDLWKFFQHTCMVNDFEVPHDFRHFINIKKMFEMKYGHIEKGQGKPAIELMLQRVGIQFEGTKHCGLDDSINIAKIVIRMLEDNVELRINQRMTRVKNFTTIDSELINDLGRKDHAEWLKKLPLKLLSVKRDDFITETYLQCESCDEKEEQDR
ncbi:hypothetical protein WR25_09637 isoform B [Diploscapter pachys]|uniref:Exonuclease domain-containing protein n=1 Tax=Diploscapter pachys TaxID=2018661 RepID=A0A2A2J5D7_9BILA|nr:hypothetical protein WR25_09637 isoform A [Diploscapter pachys]PAV56819.1 hypothetical protein WR25_09637 isoform B [Diploscapter pachys]